MKPCARRSMTWRIILLLVCVVKRCRGTVGSPERETVFYLQNVDERRPVRHMRQRGACGCLYVIVLRNISETVNSHEGRHCRCEYLWDRANIGVKTVGKNWQMSLVSRAQMFYYHSVNSNSGNFTSLSWAIWLDVKTFDSRYLCENIGRVGWRSRQSQTTEGSQQSRMRF